MLHAETLSMLHETMLTMLHEAMLNMLSLHEAYSTLLHAS